MTLVYSAKCSIADGDDFVRPLDTEKAELHERNKDDCVFTNTSWESACRQGQGLTHSGGRLSVLENGTNWHGLLLTQGCVKFLNLEKRLNRAMNGFCYIKEKQKAGVHSREGHGVGNSGSLYLARTSPHGESTRVMWMGNQDKNPCPTASPSVSTKLQDSSVSFWTQNSRAMNFPTHSLHYKPPKPTFPTLSAQPRRLRAQP